MKKIPISSHTAKIIDYVFWGITMIVLALIDWRLCVAFVAFDIMRTFENIQHDIELDHREKKLIESIKRTLCK